MSECCTVFVKVDEDAVRRGTYGLLQRPLCGKLHLSTLMNPDNENEDLSILGQTHLRQAVIAVYVYNILAGYEWKNVLSIHAGDGPGAVVEFASKEHAMIFKLGTMTR